jgi:hypothetical protein
MILFATSTLCQCHFFFT